MSLFEKHYDDMSLADKKGMDVLYEDWNESFEEAKASDDTESIYRLMHNTGSRYCLWKILQYLKETALLEDSDDPCYNSLSDEAYTTMLDTVKNLSNMFWTDRKFVSFIDMIVEISAFILADATQNGYAELAELIKADTMYRDCLGLAIKNAQTEVECTEDDEIPLWDDESDVVVVQRDNSKDSGKKGKKKKGKKKKSKDESEISDEDLSVYFDADDDE